MGGEVKTALNLVCFPESMDLNVLGEILRGGAEKEMCIRDRVPVKIVFDLRAILPVMVMFIVTAVETVGDISGVMEGGMNREPSDKELSGGVICDGLGSTFAACFGVLPNTSFSQNVGLVAMTKVVNRGALATGAVFLILCGLIPKPVSYTHLDVYKRQHLYH